MIPKYLPWFDSTDLSFALKPIKNPIPKFEASFSKLIGSRFAIAFPYGRSALYALLKAIGISKSEVIIPAYTCIVVPNAVVASNNFPHLVDIIPSTFSCSVDDIVSNVSPKTRAIIVTHMYGYLTNVTEIRDRIPENVLIVEDCALALLSEFQGKRAGTMGDAAFYSFNVGKQMTTMDGGILVTNNKDIAERVRQYRDKVFQKPSSKKVLKKMIELLIFSSWRYRTLYPVFFAFWKNHPRVRSITRNWNLYDINMPNDFIVKFTALQAKVGMAQIRKARQAIKKRQFLARLYEEKLSETPGILLPARPQGVSFSHYTIRIKNRNAFAAYLEKHGVHVGRVFDYAISEIGYYRLNYADSEYPHSERAAKEVVNLPLYPLLEADDVTFISKLVRSAVKR